MNDIPQDIDSIGKGIGASLLGLASLIKSIKNGGGTIGPPKIDPRQIITKIGEATIQTGDVLSQVFEMLIKVNTLAVRADAKVDVLIEELGDILSPVAIERLRHAATKKYADDDT